MNGPRTVSAVLRWLIAAIWLFGTVGIAAGALIGAGDPKTAAQAWLALSILCAVLLLATAVDAVA